MTAARWASAHAGFATLPEDIPQADDFIVVDEGPGLSGSSMAAVAHAREGRGVAAERIFFFPGHDAGPGHEADAKMRRQWSPECCWVTADPVRDITRTLAAHIARAALTADMPRSRREAIAHRRRACGEW